MNKRASRRGNMKNGYIDYFEIGKEGTKNYRQLILTENDGEPPYKIEYSEVNSDQETSVDYCSYLKSAKRDFKEIKQRLKQQASEQKG